MLPGVSPKGNPPPPLCEMVRSRAPPTAAPPRWAPGRAPNPGPLVRPRPLPGGWLGAMTESGELPGAKTPVFQNGLVTHQRVPKKGGSWVLESCRDSTPKPLPRATFFSERTDLESSSKPEPGQGRPDNSVTEPSRMGSGLRYRVCIHLSLCHPEGRCRLQVTVNEFTELNQVTLVTDNKSGLEPKIHTFLSTKSY